MKYHQHALNVRGGIFLRRLSPGRSAGMIVSALLFCLSHAAILQSAQGVAGVPTGPEGPAGSPPVREQGVVGIQTDSVAPEGSTPPPRDQGVVGVETESVGPEGSTPPPPVGAQGVVGIATESNGPTNSTTGVERAASPSLAYRHERGYPLNLDYARQLPMLPGRGPDIVQAMPPSTAAGPTALAPALVNQFEGIGDTGIIPADPILAVGKQKIIQVVNSTIRITSRTGSSAQTSTLAAMMGSPAGSTGFLFDPRVQFDHFANRFVVLALVTNAARTDSWYLVSVSKSEAPTTSSSSWFTYFLRSDTDGSTNTSAWGDYAPIGFDSTYFYITSNQFSPSNTFLGSKIRKYSKAPFYSGGIVSGIEWNNVTDASGNKVSTVQPAITFGAPGHEWLAAVPSGPGKSMALFRITGNTLYKYSIAVGSTGVPDQARQKGTSTRIDSGDNRLLNAVCCNSRFYTCHTVKSGTFPCAARYLGVNVSNYAAPAKVLDKVIGYPTADYYYPAVSANSAGSSLATVFNFSASDRYAGIAYTQMTSSGTHAPLGLSREGQNTYVKKLGGTRNRWGDFNGIARDPLNSNQFFFNAMYARSTINTWGTWVAATTLSTTSSPTSNTPAVAAVEPAPAATARVLPSQGNGSPVSVPLNPIRPAPIRINPYQTPINGQQPVNPAVPIALPPDRAFRGP